MGLFGPTIYPCNCGWSKCPGHVYGIDHAVFHMDAARHEYAQKASKLRNSTVCYDDIKDTIMIPVTNAAAYKFNNEPTGNDADLSKLAPIGSYRFVNDTSPDTELAELRKRIEVLELKKRIKQLEDELK